MPKTKEENEMFHLRQIAFHGKRAISKSTTSQKYARSPSRLRREDPHRPLRPKAYATRHGDPPVFSVRRHDNEQGGFRFRWRSSLAGDDIINDPSRAHSFNDLAFLMGAHEGVSAAMAERAGFKALWSSGLSIASPLGYRDANEPSWTQVLPYLSAETVALAISTMHV
ncbi:isocitrate lyase/phosphoenolpyruvate mutase family protein [Bradyrhizobium sp. Arg314]